MFYTIYKITNQIDGKIYIGSHKTKNLDDNYMGSGKYLRHAQEKYGIGNFKKEILFIYDNADAMYAKEAELVNEEFLATENTYNLKIGGSGGFDYLNDPLRYNNPTHTIDHMVMMNRSRSKDLIAYSSKCGLEAISKLISDNGGSRPWETPGFSGKTHSMETRLKMSESAKITSKGSRNSQYGTMWITDGVQNSKIPKGSDIPDGWKPGRIQK